MLDAQTVVQNEIKFSKHASVRCTSVHRMFARRIFEN